MKILWIFVASGAMFAQTQGNIHSTQGSAATSQTQKSGQPASASIPVIPGVNQPPSGPARGEERISREVRHELLMLPYYSVFDDLRYRVNGDTVELLGAVTTPSLHDDAERAARKIEGVENVINNIKILPPSPNDDRIRQAVARAVFSADGLGRYGWEAAPSIHIISDGGRVRLVGVVASEADRNLAGIRANGVQGVFSVSNELVVANGK